MNTEFDSEESGTGNIGPQGSGSTRRAPHRPGQHRRPVRGSGKGSGRRKNRIPIVGFACIFALILVGILILVIRYAPTRERMPLSDYFNTKGKNAAAVILNGEYDPKADPEGLLVDGEPYLSFSSLKANLDDGYVYDTTENTLRYVNGTQVITAYLDSPDYLVDREKQTAGQKIVVMENDKVYLDLNWAKAYTDFSFYTEEKPARIVIEKAGWKHKTAVLKWNGSFRRFGGVKSKILADGKRGDKLSVLEDYGKWSLVLTDKGVRGCIENRKLKDEKEETTKALLPEREYAHSTFDGTICLGWHQVTNTTANGRLSEVLANTKGLNVISPTWYALSDNAGSISDLSDPSYVAACHQSGIQVWALVSNFVNEGVDTTAVLNTTSSRDALVNNLIASAITTNVDGINVDFESLSIDAKDGYIEFIRELALKCRKNDLFISVDNYKPTEYTEFYNRKEQANYADYVILMGYDEHYSGSEEAGSVASLPFVEEGVKDTLEEVPADQLVLGMPFYTRVWKTDDTGLSSTALGIEDAEDFIDRNEMQMTWDEELSQNYGEFTEDGVKYQLWMEDTESLSRKLNLMKEDGLAGGAFWKLGFEPAILWDTIITYM